MFSNFARQYSRKNWATLAAGGLSAVGGTIYLTALDAKKTPQDKKVVIVGGGTGGVGVTAMLKREGIKSVTVIEPSDTHYYQPLWTLVGGGVKDKSKSAKPMKTILDRAKCDQWLQKRVKSFDPAKNEVIMEDGTRINYDYLVVAAGIQIDWGNIPGLPEGLSKDDSGVVSIYDYNGAGKTHRTFENVIKNSNGKPKNLLFTMSPTGIKCAGAPQKIMWLLEDTLRGRGIRNTCNISFWTPGGGMFGVPYYSQKLEKIRQERGVEGKFKHNLISIDVANKIAIFQNVDTKEKVNAPFDMLHVAPHMGAPDFLKKSAIADDKGWVDVDKHTLQHKKYENVFGLGDCTNTPNSKTAAAITSQAPILVHNMMLAMQDKPLDGKYNGYASCPLIIARAKIILAEFGYGGKLMETFSSETGSFPLKYIGTEGALQQRFFYFLKEKMFPFAYWQLWTRGLWFGTTGPLRPTIDRLDESEISGSNDKVKHGK